MKVVNHAIHKMNVQNIYVVSNQLNRFRDIGSDLQFNAIIQHENIVESYSNERLLEWKTADGKVYKVQFLDSYNFLGAIITAGNTIIIIHETEDENDNMFEFTDNIKYACSCNVRDVMILSPTNIRKNILIVITVLVMVVFLYYYFYYLK